MALSQDFQQFYQLDLGDLWRGTLSVRRALLLVEGLLDIPGSRFAADRKGSRDFLGWDEGRNIAAHTSDILNVILASLGGKQLSLGDLWPRPEAPEPEVGTIADFNVLSFKRMLAT